MTVAGSILSLAISTMYLESAFPRCTRKLSHPISSPPTFRRSIRLVPVLLRALVSDIEALTKANGLVIYFSGVRAPTFCTK
jgi:hypothetical protein